MHERHSRSLAPGLASVYRVGLPQSESSKSPGPATYAQTLPPHADSAQALCRLTIISARDGRVGTTAAMRSPIPPHGGVNRGFILCRAPNSRQVSVAEPDRLAHHVLYSSERTSGTLSIETTAQKSGATAIGSVLVKILLPNQHSNDGTEKGNFIGTMGPHPAALEVHS